MTELVVMKRSNYTLNTDYRYSEKKTELLRRMVEVREWFYRKVPKGQWFSAIKTEIDIELKIFNKLLNGQVAEKDEKYIKQIEELIKKYDQAV